MKIEIKNRWTAAKIFEMEAESLKDAVVAAVKSRADLSGADLSRADLSRADLSGADLSRADLSRADLSGADLSRADLFGADLSRADLSRADLFGADLSRADLFGANLKDAKNADLVIARASILPADGPIWGWKKCKNNILVKVAVGSKAKRSHAFGRKCRAEYVKVLEVVGADEGVSRYDRSVIYRKGEIVRCDKWNNDRWEECGGGIHFFLTRLEAENY